MILRDKCNKPFGIWHLMLLCLKDQFQSMEWFSQLFLPFAWYFLWNEQGAEKEKKEKKTKHSFLPDKKWFTNSITCRTQNKQQKNINWYKILLSKWREIVNYLELHKERNHFKVYNLREQISDFISCREWDVKKAVFFSVHQIRALIGMLFK